MYFLNLTVALVQVIDVLSKMAGLWIDTNKTVLYSQATHITFICPMRKGIADILLYIHNAKINSVMCWYLSKSV
jgi:hypothetical protein